MIAVHLAGISVLAANFLSIDGGHAWMSRGQLLGVRLSLLASWLVPAIIFGAAQKRTTNILEGFVDRVLPDYLPWPNGRFVDGVTVGLSLWLS